MRQMPNKTARLELSGDYEDWWLEFVLNPPAGILLDYIAFFEGKDQTNIKELVPVIYDLLELIVFNWNFVDKRGKDIKPDREGLRQLPVDLLITLAEQITATIVEVPKVQSAS